MSYLLVVQCPPSHERLLRTILLHERLLDTMSVCSTARILQFNDLGAWLLLSLLFGAKDQSEGIDTEALGLLTEDHLCSRAQEASGDISVEVAFERKTVTPSWSSSCTCRSSLVHLVFGTSSFQAFTAWSRTCRFLDKMLLMDCTHKTIIEICLSARLYL